jgi:hypothetical protein
MRLCGKAIPTRAAILLTVDFASLVLVSPLVFMVPIHASAQSGIIPDGLLNLLGLMFAGIVCQAIFYYNELYNLQVVNRGADMLGHVLRAFALLFLGLSVTCALVPSLVPVLPRVLFFALLSVFLFSDPVMKLQKYKRPFWPAPNGIWKLRRLLIRYISRVSCRPARTRIPSAIELS